MKRGTSGIRAESGLTNGARCTASPSRRHRWLTQTTAALLAIVGIGGAGAQEYIGNPVENSTITINTMTGQQGQATLVIQNGDSVTLNVTATNQLTSPLSTSLDDFTQTFKAGQTTSYTFNCDSPSAGTFSQTLNLTSNDPDRASFSYTIVCNVVAPGAQCPVIKVSGDDQILDPGTVSANLTAKFDYVTSSVPPSGSSFTWTIVSGDATFQSSGTTSTTQATLFTSVGTNLYATQSQQRIVAGTTPGAIVVRVNSADCASSAPQTFNASIANPALGVITVLGGGNASGPPGTVVQIRGRLEPIGGGNRPDARGKAAQGGELVTLNISGAARFQSNGAQTLTVVSNPSDGTFQTNVVLGPSSGSATVTANADGYDPAQWHLTTGAPPVSYTFAIVSGNNQIGLPNTDGQDLVVQVNDAQGAPVANLPVDWGVAFGFSAQLDGTRSVTGADGRAAMGFRYTGRSGSSIISATLANGQSVRFTVTAGTGGLTVLDGDNQSGVSGTRADDAIVFQLSSQQGLAIPGATIAFAVASGDATLVSPSAVTDAQGRVQATFNYGAPGPIRISATYGDAVAFASATSIAGALNAVSGNGQTGVAGTRLPDPLVVQLAPAPTGASFAKGLAGVTVTWEVLSGGGQLGSATTVTDAQGRSSNTYTLGPAAGVNQIRASTAGGVSVVFTATATGGTGNAAQFEIVSGNNQTIPTNTPSEPLVVRVRTAAGAPVANQIVTWRFTPVANGTVSPTQSTTNANGEASTVATIGLPGPAQVTATLNATGPGTALTFTLNGGVQNLPALTDNQESVGRAIDTACPQLAVSSNLTPAQQDLLQRCSELVVGAGTNAGNVRDALSEMVADEAAAQGDAAISTTAAQFDNLKARIAALRSGSRGASFGGLAIAGDGGVLPLSFLPSNIVQDDTATASGEAGAEFSRWGFFATGTVGRGDHDRTENNPGFDFDTYGLTAGVDYRYSDALVLGAALGYTNNDTDIGGDQGTLETKGYSISGYATYYKDDAFYTDAVLTWGRNSYDIARRIRYTVNNLSGGTTVVNQRATASPDGDQTALALSFGRDFARGAWNLGPYARATYTKIDFDPYIERMSDPNGPGSGLAMAVDGRDLKSLEGVLGGKASYTVSTSWGVLMPNITVEWLHEFEDSPDDVVTRFVNDPSGTDILIAGDDVDSNYFNLGLGLSGVFANGRSAFVYYEHRAGQADFTQDSLAIGVRIEF